MMEDFNAKFMEPLDQINESINVLYKDIDERLKVLEAKVAGMGLGSIKYGPIPITCDTAEAAVQDWSIRVIEMDALADEAMRTVEDG